jgi:L-fuculose-phosphate aldolase
MKREGKKAETLARKAVVATAREMSRRGLSPGRSGNVSCRWKTGMLITPTALAYDEMKARDIVFVASDGTVPADQRAPSSEWQFHLAAYRARPDMSAVVHTHSIHATALACCGKPIPAFHYMVAVAGGNDIPVVPYATFGTSELAGHVAEGLLHRTACLMANHGVIALGATLPAALALAAEVEILAEQYAKALAIGAPNILPDDEMALMVEKFKTYGRQSNGI